MFSRREILKNAFGLIGLAALLPKTAWSEEKRRPKKGAGGGAELPLVQPGKGMASSVNYQHSHSDVKDAGLKVDRQGTPFAKQYCSNCMLYTKDGMRGSEEVGKCTLFANQVVKAQGFCSSWSKKS